MPATAHTVVSITNGNAPGLVLPERVQLAPGDNPLFETTQPLFASTAGLVKVLSGKAPLFDATDANSALRDFDAFGSRPRIGHALYLGFDTALESAGATLSLYVWSNRWQRDAITRAALIAEQEARIAQRPPYCPPASDWRRHYRVEVAWEFHAGSDKWLPLEDVVDETRALTLSGFVHFRAPVNHQAGGPGPAFFIRCRIVKGRFECPPRLRHVAFNTVDCEHALTRAQRDLGLSRGHAQARYSLEEAPIVAGSVALTLDDGAGTVESDWSEAPNFDRAGAHDRVFALDPELGELQSGDGLRAEVLPAGFHLLASFRAGGNVEGNIVAGTLTGIPQTAENIALVPTLAALAVPLQVLQPFAAEGGAPRETLAEAQARAFGAANTLDKAVTLEDIERLALSAPGLPIARVRAVANMEPQFPCFPAPGVITLITVPFCPRPAPLPSRALLDALEDYLEPRRLVTSEIRAIAPHYRHVAVNATLHLACDTKAEEVLAAAVESISAFFDPLDGGPDRTGWPIGRAVYRSEMMALLADIPGVARVTSLTLQSSCCGEQSGGSCDNIELCAHELVVPGKHRLLVESEVARSLKRSDPHECESV
jgi:phage-related baseplate assembly protein